MRDSEKAVLEVLNWRLSHYMHEGRAQRYTPISDPERALIEDFIHCVYDDLADLIDAAQQKTATD